MRSSTITRRLLAVGAISLAGATLLTACGGDSDSGSSSYKEPTGPVVKKLTVESGNIFFRPTELTSPAGVVQITLKNIQSGSHTFVIKGVPGFELQVAGDGKTDTGKVELAKGSYEYYCTIPGHKAAGMDGTLTVS